VLDPTFEFDFRNGAIFDSRVMIGGVPTKYQTRQGRIEPTAATSDPRYEYDFVSNQYTGGVSIEPIITHVCLQSHFAATWTAKNCSISSGTVADPAGGTDARTITASANSAFVSQTVVATAGRTRTFSVWIRRRTGTGTVQIQTHAANVVTCNVTTSWNRFSVTRNGSGTGNFSYSLRVLIATSGDAVDVWGAQLEEALSTSQPMSNVLTTTATASSPSDSLEIDFYDGISTSTSATFIWQVDVARRSSAVGNVFVRLFDTSGDAFVYLYDDGNTMFESPNQNTAGAQEAADYEIASGIQSWGISVTPTTFTIAKSTTISGSTEGYSFATTTDLDVPEPWNWRSISITGASLSSLRGWQGYVRYAAMFDYALPNSELLAVLGGL